MALSLSSSGLHQMPPKLEEERICGGMPSSVYVCMFVYVSGINGFGNWAIFDVISLYRIQQIYMHVSFEFIWLMSTLTILYKTPFMI